jgi:hypothetical protein
VWMWGLGWFSSREVGVAIEWLFYSQIYIYMAGVLSNVFSK